MYRKLYFGINRCKQNWSILRFLFRDVLQLAGCLFPCFLFFFAFFPLLFRCYNKMYNFKENSNPLVKVWTTKCAILLWCLFSLGIFQRVNISSNLCLLIDVRASNKKKTSKLKPWHLIHIDSLDRSCGRKEIKRLFPLFWSRSRITLYKLSCSRHQNARHFLSLLLDTVQSPSGHIQMKENIKQK